MKPAHLLAHFDRISDAPDVIPRMRQFVLDLAMQGKLVEQDSSDEPASQLLGKILDEKAFASRKGAKRRQRSLPEAAMRYSLPKNWTWTFLGHIAEWGSGSTPSRGNLEFYEGHITWLKSGELNDNRELTGSQEKITDAALECGSFRLNQPGDVLFAMYGATVGKAAILAEPAVTNQAVCGCTPFPGVLNLYLFYYLLSQRQEFRESSEGGAQPNFSKDKILTYPFPLPPFAEQRRIVVKVDELMELCDRLEAAQTERESRRDQLAAASLHRLSVPVDSENDHAFREYARFTLRYLPRLIARPKQVQRFRQTALELAVRGKLVPQDPEDEPASELLKRIQAEKARRVREGSLREQKPSQPIEEEETEFELPNGWQWVLMADVIKLWNGYAFKSDDFQREGVPVIRIGDLQSGQVVLSDTVCVSEAVANTVGREIWIPPRALLIAMSGATTGKVAFNGTGRRLLLNQRVGRIEVFLMSPQFIRIFFETIVVRNLSISFGTAIPNLSARQINEIAVPLPPLAEQRRIVAKVEELMALCDRLKAALTTAQTESGRLLEAVLNEALTVA
jgi:type I restriction enzyme S subunit